MNANDQFRYLLDRHIAGSITLGEKNDFFALIATGNFDALLSSHFDETYYDSSFNLNENEYALVDEKIIANILESEKRTESLLKPTRSYRMLWLAAAASVVIAVSFSFFYRGNKNPQEKFLADFIDNSPEKVFNNTISKKIVTLPEGSIVTLMPGAAVYYSKALFTSNREVTMEGEAAFNITRNPEKPFYVYYHDVVTKVLGTTFNISTNKKSGDIEVAVLSGKVQVYENKAIHTDANNASPVMITPNQKAVYQPQQRMLGALLIDKPVLLKKHRLPNNSKQVQTMPVFNFENAKLYDVLKNIEESYGIEISVPNTAVYNCAFSGDVTSQDLFNKLKIISIATNSNYKITGTKIIFKGSGCP